MKLKRFLYGFILCFILLTPVSIYLQFKNTSLYFSCIQKSGESRCKNWEIVDAVLALPVFIIQKITPIQFIWGDKARGARVCDMRYEGIKIGSYPLYIADKECIPI